MVESSREKAKANHETLRQSMIEEFREDRELAMEEFKQALEDVKVVQLNVRYVECIQCHHLCVVCRARV